MPNRLVTSPRSQGFKWDRVNRFLATGLIVTGLISGVSFFDYSKATLARNSRVGIQAITSDAPLTAFHLITSFTTQYINWINGHSDFASLQLASDLLEFRFTADNNFGETFNTFMQGDFKSALNRVNTVKNRYKNQTLTAAESRIVHEQVSADLDTIEKTGFVMSRNYFRSIVNTFEGGADVQSARALRTIYLFIGFLIFLFFLSFRIIRFQIEAIKYERLIEEESARLLDVMKIQLTEARASIEEVANQSANNNDYLSTVNHELRTPLTSIIGYVDLLRDIKTINQDDELSTYLDVMDRNSIVLLDIIEDILTMSKYESQNQNLTYSKIDLIQSVKDQWTELSLVSAKKHLQFELNHSEGSFFVSADDTQIRQVLRNLLSNAIKYSAKNSQITVNLLRETQVSGSKFIEVVIRDQGIGIPEDELTKIFDKFYRASNSDSEGAKGTGLGLAIVKNILLRFGGDIWVESSVGVGTTFVIRIPEYLDETERMILESRAGVLERAIEGISASSLANLQADTHQFGGAIGFYNFPEESDILLDFSRWLKSNMNGNSEIILEKKERILRGLRNSLSKIEPPKEM